MKWFNQWLARRIKEAAEISERDQRQPKGECIAVEADHHGLHDGLKINIKTVIGGKLVTFNHYDRRKDENQTRTYIITEEQEFERELGKIITLESMRL